ncbi:MAG: NFACT family protein [Thermoplasmata archaeon]|nr:NFACT family protein [Thermoplasmata archaeon]
MKESQSSFDVMASVKELQALVGGHVDKIYHPSLGHLILAVRLPGEGKSFVHFWVGKWLHRSGKGQESGQQPSDFAMMLRKRIANARISAVRQQGFDRIAVLSLEKEEKFDLVLELFAEGNIVLVKDGTIVQPLTSHTWKHRDIRARKPFLFPPPVPDPNTMTEDEFLSILRSSDTDIVRTVATKLNTGGRYSEEICARASIDKKTASRDVPPEESARILRTIKDFAKEVAASGLGFIVFKIGKAEDVVPVRMRIYDGLDHREFPSYSEALEEYIGLAPKERKAEPRETTLEADRLRRKLAQQESAIQTLQDEAREAQLRGDFLFANYGSVSRVLASAKDQMAEAKNMKDIPGFVEFNGRTSVLKVMVNEVPLELDVKGSVESNAQRYYDGAKKARKKLEGVLTALEVARGELRDAVSGLERADKAAKARREPTKRFWFERFRWFISSEDAVVLGGKDAKSNDMLVKKHLEAGDRYAHADSHGAPSVVVKMRDGVTEKTLYEACEFAVATSKAWNAKIGSASGYWVLPEQVSKTPQSGEYLAKGAFVIRGKRNYSEKLKISLGVGEIEFEGSRKIMGGPESAVRTHSKRFVIIRPGEKDRNDLAKKLAEVFDVPIEEIQSILPPGDVDIVEQVGLSISL